MTLNPFTYIREQAKAAFLGGIADGLAVVIPEGSQPLTLEQIGERLALPAPAPATEDAPKRKGTAAK